MSTMEATESPVTPENLMRLGLGFWGSKAFLSAVEMELFTLLADGPKDLPTIQSELGLHGRGAADFLDALVSMKVLTRADGKYRNAADTDLFLDKNKPTYVGGMLEMANHRLFGFWGNLTEALKTGEPQNEAKSGEDFFAKIYADPAQLEGFLKAMTGISMGSAMALAAKFDWKDYKTFADIGCAQGVVPVQLALAHPHLTGIGYDLPPVAPVFNRFAQEFNLEDRLAFQGGNFFEESLPQADVLVMGHILHDWNLDEKKMLLGKAYAALPEGGALVVYEAMIDDNRDTNTFGLLMSLNMLIETSGGFDYTGADCQTWMTEVGFNKTRQEHLVGPDFMVVGLK